MSWLSDTFQKYVLVDMSSFGNVSAMMSESLYYVDNMKYKKSKNEITSY